jgi:hypothetical protein
MNDWRQLGYEDLVELDSPCDLAKKLKAARLKLLAGEKDVEIEHQGLERRRVRFAETNMSRLDALIRTLETECARKQGRRVRASAIAKLD